MLVSESYTDQKGTVSWWSCAKQHINARVTWTITNFKLYFLEHIWEGRIWSSNAIIVPLLYLYCHGDMIDWCSTSWGALEVVSLMQTRLEHLSVLWTYSAYFDIQEYFSYHNLLEQANLKGSFLPKHFPLARPFLLKAPHWLHTSICIHARVGHNWRTGHQTTLQRSVWGWPVNLSIFSQRPRKVIDDMSISCRLVQFAKKHTREKTDNFKVWQRVGKLQLSFQAYFPKVWTSIGSLRLPSNAESQNLDTSFTIVSS